MFHVDGFLCRDDSSGSRGQKPQGGSGHGKNHVLVFLPNMDLSYMLNAAPTAKKMARTLADNEELPEAYNAIESGKLTTEVRQQGGWGTCWAFSGTGAMASDLFEEMGEDAPVFSPIHLAYFAFHGRANPDDPADGTEGDTYLPFEYNESDGDKEICRVYPRRKHLYCSGDSGKRRRSSIGGRASLSGVHQFCRSRQIRGSDPDIQFDQSTV